MALTTILPQNAQERNLVLKQRIRRDFSLSLPTPEQAEIFKQLADKTMEYALFLADIAPSSRELSIALTDLEHVESLTRKAIMRNSESEMLHG